MPDGWENRQIVFIVRVEAKQQFLSEIGLVGLMFSLYMDNWCWSRRVRYQRAGLYCLPVRIYGDYYNWAYIL